MDSIQIEHAKVESASVGQDIGIKTDQPAHENDQIFKVIEWSTKE